MSKKYILMLDDLRPGFIRLQAQYLLRSREPLLVVQNFFSSVNINETRVCLRINFISKPKQGWGGGEELRKTDFRLSILFFLFAVCIGSGNCDRGGLLQSPKNQDLI